MKLLVILSLVVVCVWGHNVKLPGLEHFPKEKLSKGFQEFTAPAECSPEVKQCLACVHVVAKKCVFHWFRANGRKVQECTAQNPEVAQANEEWQKASYSWHKGFDMCIKNEDIPEGGSQEEESTEDEQLFRMKRNLPDNLDIGECETTYDNAEDCWKGMKRTRGQCMRSASQCTQYMNCIGRGERPTDSKKAQWYDYIKELIQNKKDASDVYHRVVHECLYPEHTGPRPKLWE